MSKKPIPTIIVDDEALARRGLKIRLKEIPAVEVVGEARSAAEAVRRIRELRPQLVFLDIQMPGQSGFAVVEQLDQAELPAVVFVTAFDEHAIRAFEVNAVDYLLKPVDGKRLGEAVERAARRIRQKSLQEHKRQMQQLARELAPAGSRKLAIRDGGKTTWVRHQDIEWIEAAGDYMCVHARGETHIMRKTMKDLERELQAECLQRIHRSTIVNVERVTEMRSHINGEYFLTLESGHMVKLSRSYKDKLRFLLPGQ